MQDRDWQRLVDQVRHGDCTPFVGAGASTGILPNGGLPTGAQLSEYWADYYDYPFAEGRSNLSDVMQYAIITEHDPVTVKRRVAEHLAAFGEPDSDDPDRPHAVLAKLGLPVYLTTNYDGFMAQALHRAGRSPKVAVCPWYRDAPAAFTDAEAAWQPSVDEPLVYHLHGTLAEPESIVISERDYLEFLINLTMERDGGRRRLVPDKVLPALTRKALLFVGYSLRDPSVRMLFHGLVETVTSVQRRRHVSVQVDPLPADLAPDVRRRAMDYLTTYFDELEITIYWGTVDDFCAELLDRLAAAG